MAKATHSGPSFNEHELSDPNPPPVVRRFQIGDDALRPGSNLRQSSATQAASSSNSATSGRSPVQTTDNRSMTDPVEPSTVPMTGGNGLETEQPPSHEEGTEELAGYEEWSVPDLREECRARGLSTAGGSKALVARLQADDEESPDQ